MPCGKYHATSIVRFNLPDQFRNVPRFCLIDLKSEVIGKGRYRRLRASVLSSINGSNARLAQHMNQMSAPAPARRGLELGWDSRARCSSPRGGRVSR